MSKEIPGQQAIAFLERRGKRQEQLAEEAVRELRGETGDSVRFGPVLQEQEDLSVWRGRGLLDKEQLKKWNDINIFLGNMFGYKVLDVISEWKRAERVRNAARAERR